MARYYGALSINFHLEDVASSGCKLIVDTAVLKERAVLLAEGKLLVVKAVDDSQSFI